MKALVTGSGALVCALALSAVACSSTGNEGNDSAASNDGAAVAAANAAGTEDASDDVAKTESEGTKEEERLGEARQALAVVGNWVTNVKVTAGSSANVACPAGYEKIPGDLNAGASGKYIYLCVSHDPAQAGPYDYWPLGRLVGRASFQNQIYGIGGAGYDPKSDYCEYNDSDYGCLRSNVAAYSSSNADLNQGAGGWYEFLSKTSFVPLPSGPYARLLDVQVSLTASCPAPAYNQAAEQAGFEAAVFYIPGDAGGGTTKDANYKAGGKYVYICQYLYPFWPS
jgi:hypothetical protein